ncbi:MAG TPA: hypothetical protein VFC19_18325 [Candidatus Limnocylindrales bacterium]|nr:hypothetical protein [Candidatus Limnocylindrales bacterium]
MTRSLNRSLGTTLALVALTGSLLVTTAAPAMADTVFGTVIKPDNPLHVRSGPRLEYVSIAERQRGDRVALQCHTSGEEVGGSRNWFQIANGGFVPEAFIEKDGTTPECDYAGTAPRPNPRTKDEAIDWQFRRLGSTAWEGLCLAFQRASFGWGSSGWDTAERGGDWIANNGFMHTTGVPPRGALVWYHNSSGTGHVVVSIGGGDIIGTSVNGKVGVAGFRYHEGYRGWSVPYFPQAS